MNGSRAVACAVVGLIVLGGCGAGGSGTGSGSKPADPASGAASVEETGVAVAQTAFRQEIDRLTWPTAYRPSIDGLSSKLGDPDEVVITSETGKDLANIWNLCAWLNEGVDRIGRSAPPEQLEEAGDRIDAWAADTADPLGAGRMADQIRTGDPTGPNQFIVANDCRDFPS